jgi:hypothetical protein
MVPFSETGPPQGITRREAIRRAALLAGVALSPNWLEAVERTAQSAPSQRLTSPQAAVVSAVAERILPRTDTPGATDVGVPAFIDLLYGDFMTPDEQKTLIDGLAKVDAASKAAFGASFVALAPDRQDTVLRDIARAEEKLDQGFFRLIRSATILGYFTSEQVGRNVLHYDPVPGRYDACVPIDEVGRRNWTT